MINGRLVARPRVTCPSGPARPLLPVGRPAEPASESRYAPVNVIIKSEWQLERERVLTMRQASRDAAKARREATWASLPVKYYTDEDLARSKYSIARQLWHNGRVDSSRRFLEQLIADYPLTDTAARAKVVLMRF
jgi:predicted Zn-dependent protease